MGKVSLIFPPDTNVLDAEKYPPVTLLFVASALQLHGIDTEILELGNKEIDSYKQVGYADVFGLTATTASYLDTLKFAKGLKRQYPQSKLILGGIHATTVPEQIPLDVFDAVAIGEVEDDILKVLNENGLVKGGRPRNLDKLYPLAWSLIDVDKYLKKDTNMDVDSTLTTLFSRGCPHSCNFCYNRYSNEPLISPSPIAIKREIKHLIENYGIKALNIMDDNTGLFIKTYLSTLNEFAIQWSIETSIPSMLKGKIIEECIQNGCIRFMLGVESGSDSILKLMNKPHNTYQCKSVIERIKAKGGSIRALLMAGYPGETWATVKETIEFINSLPLDYRDSINVNMFTPYPGTDVYKNPEKYGITWISDKWSDFRPQNKNRQFQIAFETEGVKRDERMKMANALRSETKGK